MVDWWHCTDAVSNRIRNVGRDGGSSDGAGGSYDGGTAIRDAISRGDIASELVVILMVALVTAATGQPNL